MYIIITRIAILRFRPMRHSTMEPGYLFYRWPSIPLVAVALCTSYASLALAINKTALNLISIRQQCVVDGAIVAKL